MMLVPSQPGQSREEKPCFFPEEEFCGGITVRSTFDGCMCVEGAVTRLLPRCLSVAGALRGALLQAGSWFLRAPRPLPLAENTSGFWVEAIPFYVVSTKEPWSAEVLRPASVH